MATRRVWRFQRGNMNPKIEEDRQHSGQKKKDKKGQTTIYKTLHIAINIE
jgi:hypothetical protein